MVLFLNSEMKCCNISKQNIFWNFCSTGYFEISTFCSTPEEKQKLECGNFPRMEILNFAQLYFEVYNISVMISSCIMYHDLNLITTV